MKKLLELLINKNLIKLLNDFLNKIIKKNKVKVNYPERLITGNNVQIASTVVIDTLGGVVVGDSTIILDNVNISTSLPDIKDDFYPHTCLPVVIGKNVKINNDVNIEPGSIIMDDTNVVSGTTVKGIVTSDKTVFTLRKKFFNKFNSYFKKKTSAFNLGKDIVFVVSTGRAGSTSIAKVLNEHPEIVGRHEFYKILIWLSTLYEHNEISENNLCMILKAVFLSSSIYLKNHIYIESDHKLFNLINLLAKVLPEAKFIWLVRNAKDFIASSLPRGWYSENEKHYLKGSKEYVKYRIRGDKCGVFSKEEWTNMSQFEKHCWYWTYINCKIEEQLKHINSNRWICIKLEDLNSNIHLLESFLDKRLGSITFSQLNKGLYKKFQNSLWEHDLEEAFNLICRPTLKKLDYHD